MDIKKLGTVLDRNDTKHIFIAEAKKNNVKIDPAEILEAKWFPINKLPPKNEQTFSLQESLKLANLS